ncbi:uncharacterized protein LY79DRAFT_241604 [Colletotrichum navitas]|uniref:Uncharacterized protein n=1 Tax=Colletotrichum navitas TaxID=681940 RepID=A0AAD8PWT8_9PEZI|nr:uncharacterized protein LY79DRAFT_241604 [Colletotrichum navitas]KAK1586160.1 hypothetical protein LY79DRAFT_241604 [Colletotrichum navitas]
MATRATSWAWLRRPSDHSGRHGITYLPLLQRRLHSPQRWPDFPLDDWTPDHRINVSVRADRVSAESSTTLPVFGTDLPPDDSCTVHELRMLRFCIRMQSTTRPAPVPMSLPLPWETLHSSSNQDFSSSTKAACQAMVVCVCVCVFSSSSFSSSMPTSGPPALSFQWAMGGAMATRTWAESAFSGDAAPRSRLLIRFCFLFAFPLQSSCSLRCTLGTSLCRNFRFRFLQRPELDRTPQVSPR